VVDFLVKEADILINPSFREGLPTTVLEGLLAKCVVIATDVGGTREISDKADLLLVEAKNVQQLVKAIEEVVPKVEVLKGISYESVREKFDWDKNMEKYIQVYKKV
jgi:glycosyltransferase involved in cell wall biosynthesis